MGLWKDKIRKDWRYFFLYRGKSYAGEGFKTRAQAEEARGDRRKELKTLSPTQGGMALSLGVSLYLDQAEKRFRPKARGRKGRDMKGMSRQEKERASALHRQVRN